MAFFPSTSPTINRANCYTEITRLASPFISSQRRETSLVLSREAKIDEACKGVGSLPSTPFLASSPSFSPSPSLSLYFFSSLFFFRCWFFHRSVLLARDITTLPNLSFDQPLDELSSTSSTGLTAVLYLPPVICGYSSLIPLRSLLSRRTPSHHPLGWLQDRYRASMRNPSSS